ncbi:MAG TPA: RluA family pseudouridine synthase [Planctomycetota bacterium]|nr:RluA family pseudouridine synthase [Planctomycetota bacterium]
MDLPVLHQDEHLVVIDKPAGVLVVTAPGRRAPTVLDLLRTQLERQVLAVHRLDEDTTGALIVALTDACRAGMEDLFRRHAVQRDYLALLAATPSPAAGRIEANLEEGADGIVRVVSRAGVRAVTHYTTIARRGRCCLVTCRLETGRRNQIRAHMAALGCPLAGDRKYGFRARAGERFSRAMLHSWRVGFEHPITGTGVAVEVPPPEPELRP